MRFSLFAKIILWFFLNLLLLGVILAFIFNFKFDSRSSFFAGASNKIETVTRLIESETNEKSREERDEILKRYSDHYGVDFFLFDKAGRQIAGRETTLPPEVFHEITRAEGPGPGGENRSNSDILQQPRPGPPPSVYITTENPSLYWFVGRIMTVDRETREPYRTRLLTASDSYTGYGLFFDPTPFVVVAVVVIGFSILFWLPFVRHITKDVRRMTVATEQIADEDFDVRVSEKRTDELGRLGTGINHLASRLSGFVSGQKRFLGDISHELNSPLARMQFALSILEERVEEKDREYVGDVKEEVELMSRLVAELLAYSKAGIKAPDIELERVRLQPLVELVVQRETAKDAADIKLEVDEDLEVLAQPELLSRALGNVVRNAVRYAGSAGEISISAENSNNRVKITVADSGAGVPDANLEKLFDPFYRIESDRSRQTGGTGLGLAIVKTCIEACRGKVHAENLEPKGFAVIITLKN